MFQNIFRLTFIIIFFVVSAISLLLFFDFIEFQKKPKPFKKAQYEITLKEIINLDWTIKITDIPEIFPGGKLLRQDPSTRALALYTIKARLINISEIADLDFHQNEEYIRGVSKEATNIRKLTFECKSAEDQKAKFERLCAHVKFLESEVYTITNPTHVDAEYSINDPDEKGGINITLRMFTLLSKHSVIMDITRFKRIRVIKPNRLKHNKANEADV